MKIQFEPSDKAFQFISNYLEFAGSGGLNAVDEENVSIVAKVLLDEAVAIRILQNKNVRKLDNTYSDIEVDDE